MINTLQLQVINANNTEFVNTTGAPHDSFTTDRSQ
jgi:hypothetical protein